MIRNILVVCTGNICRSPMAEGLLRSVYGKRVDFSVSSAGVAALVGESPAEEAVTAMRSHGIDISACRARQCDGKLLTQADLVLVMEEMQRKWIHYQHPQTRGKVFLMGHWRKGEVVPDPYGQPHERFEQVLLQLDQHVKDWLQVLK
ncbi:MAG: low molecular weight protein-tyrosine-phosphatase [Nevskiales bacterium]